MERKKCVIGIDIGGTNIRIGKVDKNNAVWDFQKISTQHTISGDNALQKLGKFIKEYIDNSSSAEEILSIAIGFPATLNKERTIVISAPNIKGLDNAPAKEYLESVLSIPVFLERDVCMLFFNDVRAMQLDTSGIIIGCYVGTGIGNVISINGTLLVGKDGVACELGHIPVIGNHEVCGCGNVGCLESIGAGRYLSMLVENEFQGTEIGEVFTKHKNSELIITFVDRIACGIATEVNILNPNDVILGGGILDMKDFPKDLLGERVKFHLRKPYPANNLHILYSNDDEKNGVMGSGLLAWRA